MCQADWPDSEHVAPPKKLVVAWRGVTGDQALWWSTRVIPKSTDEIKIVDAWEVAQKIDSTDNSNAGPSVGSRNINTL